MKYSVIIPTYNRLKTFRETLKSVINQSITPSGYEILVIDDGSTDGTREIVAELQNKNPHHFIRYFYQKNSGVAKARNRGVEEARGKIIFFTDDDCIVPPDWMENILDGFRRYPDVVGVGGWYDPPIEWREKYVIQNYLYLSRHWDYGWKINDTEVKTNLFYEVPVGNTANTAFKREVFETLGKFDETINFTGLVDWEFKKRLSHHGCQMLYIPKPVIHNKQLSLWNFINQSFRRGRGAHYMSLKYPDILSSGYYRINLRDILERFLEISAQQNLSVAQICSFFIEYFSRFAGKIWNRLISFKPRKVFVKGDDGMDKNIVFSILEKKVGGNESKYSEFTPYKPVDFPEPKSFISVIVPTFNRADLLAKSLSSLLAQDIPPENYEIIVIDDGSTDDTESRIKNYESRIKKPKIRYFRQDNKGPAEARNLGIRNARGEITCFTDDDCTHPKNWLRTMTGYLESNRELAGVGGWLFPKEEELKNNYFNKYLVYYFFLASGPVPRYYRIRTTNPEKNFAYNTANIAYRKKALEEAGGFNPFFKESAYEDVDLALRILEMGYPLLWIPFHVTHLKNFKTLEEFLKSRYNRGRGRRRFLYLHPANSGVTIQSLSYTDADFTAIGALKRFFYLGFMALSGPPTTVPLFFLDFIAYFFGYRSLSKELKRDGENLCG